MSLDVDDLVARAWRVLARLASTMVVGGAIDAENASLQARLVPATGVPRRKLRPITAPARRLWTSRREGL